MNDRVAIITGTQAAKAFPALASFLATSTNLTSEVAEQALRHACGDNVQQQTKAAQDGAWKQAIARANGSLGAMPETEPPASAGKASHPWGDIAKAINHERGLA